MKKSRFSQFRKKYHRGLFGHCFSALVNGKPSILRNTILSFLEIYYRLTKQKDIFSSIYIEINTACNLRCKYCPNSKYDNALVKNMKEMNMLLFCKVIDELAKIKWVGEIALDFYNEPLLDERLPELVKYARINLPVNKILIFSNGELLTLDKYKELVSAGADYFCVTQHLGNNSKANMKEIMEYRKTSNEDNIFFGVYGKRRLIFNRGGLINLDEKTSIKPTRCTWVTHMVGIDFEGNVLICCQDYFRRYKAGNINEEKLMDIWNKPFFVNFRKDIRKGIFKLEMCQKCARGYLESDY